MRTTKVPDHPWSRVAVYMFTLQNRGYVFLGEYYSDFEEVQETGDTTSPTITHFLKEQFNRHGIPEVFVLDSGPQLTSHEFRRFAEELEFKHVTSSPHHHKSNGKAQSLSHQEPFQESAARWKRPIACPVRIQKHTFWNHWIKSIAEADVSMNEDSDANSLSLVTSSRRWRC